MNINCILMDDEPLSRKGLKEYIAILIFFTLLENLIIHWTATDMLGRGAVQLIFPGYTNAQNNRA